MNTRVGVAPIVSLKNASLSLGGRSLWRNLNVEVEPGEFVAILGPNGSGKSSFLKVLLGLLPLTGGSAAVDGSLPRRGNRNIGYIPQRQAFDPDLPLRGRDLVRMGLDGHRFGWSWSSVREEGRVREVLSEIGAESFADRPIGLLSGGEQQRLRIAEALISRPRLLLCDEPLLSLDIARQQAVSDLIESRRQQDNTAVLFVTHEINPILPLVDRVIYLVGGKFAIGRPEDVMTTERLTELYGVPVDVLKVRDRIVVVGSGEAGSTEGAAHHTSKRYQ